MRQPFTPDELHDLRVKRLRYVWAQATRPCRLCGSKESFFTHWCQEGPSDPNDPPLEAITNFEDRFKSPWVAHQSGRGNWVVDGRFGQRAEAERIAKQVRQRTKRKTVIVEAATRNHLERALDSGTII